MDNIQGISAKKTLYTNPNIRILMRKDTNKKKQVWISIGIAIIMVSSILGYMFGSDDANTYKYNKITFYQKNLAWAAKISNKDYEFNYFPDTIDYINVSSGIVSRIKSTFQLDCTYDLNDTHAQDLALAQQYIELTLMQSNSIYVRKAATAQNKYNLPVLTCKNATSAVPVIYLRIANETKIYSEDNCIIAQGRDGADILRVKDRILFGVLGVIK
jgi:hypothetical protein